MLKRLNANYIKIKNSRMFAPLLKPIHETMYGDNLDMILSDQEYAKAADLKIRYKIVKKIENFLLIKPL